MINNEYLFNDYIAFTNKIYTHEEAKLNTLHHADSVLNNYLNIYGTLLVYRIPFPYCESCIMPSLKELQKLSEEKQIDKILVLTSFLNEKEYSKFKQYVDTSKLNYCNIPELELNINSKESEGAYSFLISKQSIKPQFLFFNSRLNNRIFISYLNTIKNKLQ